MGRPSAIPVEPSNLQTSTINLSRIKCRASLASYGPEADFTAMYKSVPGKFHHPCLSVWNTKLSFNRKISHICSANGIK